MNKRQIIRLMSLALMLALALPAKAASSERLIQADGAEVKYAGTRIAETDDSFEEEGFSSSVYIGLGVGTAVGLIVCFAAKKQMHTAVKQTYASDYVTHDGVVISHRSDHYTHTTTTRQKIKNEN